jgi:MFS family permease
VVLSGPLADLLKRKTVAYLAIAIATVLSYPFVLAILEKQIAVILVLQFLITLFGIGLLHGLAPILTSESFPTKYRYSGTGISYNLSAILGGGIAPSLLAGLIGPDVAAKWYFVPIVYVIYCVVAMASLLSSVRRAICPWKGSIEMRRPSASSPRPRNSVCCVA